MDNLFDPAVRDRTLARIEALRPDSPRGWGKMDPAQALRHCAIGVEAATGEFVLPRPFMARLLGPLFKNWVIGPKPFSKDSPTHPLLVMKDPADFDTEKARLLAAVRRFCDAGPAAAAKYEHGFVGRLTGEQWGIMQAKHLDHHLRQFGSQGGA